MKRAADTAASPAAEWSTLRLRPFGAGAEVGRSCLLLRFKGLTVMLDCGVLPSFQNEACLPMYREVDPATVDVIIITCVMPHPPPSLPSPSPPSPLAPSSLVPYCPAPPRRPAGI